MVVFTLVSVVSGIVIWFVSQSARRGKSDEELIAEGLADREIVEGSSAWTSRTSAAARARAAAGPFSRP